MAKGLSRQSVHPMETTSTKEHSLETLDYQEEEDEDNSQEVANSSSEVMHDSHRNVLPQFGNRGFSSMQQQGPWRSDVDEKNSPISSLVVGAKGQDIGYANVTSMDGNGETETMAGNGYESYTATQNGSNQNSNNSAPKSARRLTFADEIGGALTEVNYSNRTHYSKHIGPGALGDQSRGCCVIS